LKEIIGGSGPSKARINRVFLEPAAPDLCKTTEIICIKYIHVNRYFNVWLSTILTAKQTNRSQQLDGLLEI
jgi:hypothetical protein